MIFRRRPPPGNHALGIIGLAATARGMLAGRLYAAAVPQAQIASRCMAVTIADTLRGGGRAVAIMHTPVNQFLAVLAACDVAVKPALDSGQLIVLKQTGLYDEKLVTHGAQHFVDELDYLGVQPNSLVAIEHAERLFSADDRHQGLSQARIYQRWLDDAGATGLLLFQTPALDGTASPLLHSLDDSCAGLAYLRAEGSGFVWQVEHWLSPDGSTSRREFSLSFDEAGTLQAAGLELDGVNATIQHAPDQDRVIVTAAAVEGEHGVPAHWRIVADIGTLLEAAEGAIAATCVIDFQGSEQLRVLARAVHHLRRKCGRGLHIVVREYRQRLRYNDELLLLRLGANTVVYAEVGFSRFIALIAALRNQAYSGEILDDFERAVQAALPPAHCGYLTASAFCDTVRDCLAQSAHIGVESTLVCLYLLPETAHLEALRACRIKRPGDLLTADRSSIWLFLYACRAPDVDATLDRLYSEPLAQMFEGHVGFFSSVDILGAIDGLETRLDATPATDYSSLLATAPAVLPAAVVPVAASSPQPVAGLPLLRPQAVTTVAGREVRRQPLRLTGQRP